MSRHIHDIDYAEFIKAKEYVDKFKILLNSSTNLCANVKGSSTSPYQVTLIKNHKYLEIEGHCSCPAFDRYLECKHIAAVIKYGTGEFFQQWDPEYYFLGARKLKFDDICYSRKLTFKDLHQSFLEDNHLPSQNNPLNFYQETPK